MFNSEKKVSQHEISKYSLIQSDIFMNRIFGVRDISTLCVGVEDNGK